MRQLALLKSKSELRWWEMILLAPKILRALFPRRKG